MQAGESVSLWKYQYNNNNNQNSTSSPVKPSSKGVMDDIPYLNCQARLACGSETIPKANFFCYQCRTLQCSACEKHIHQDSDKRKHERSNLDEMDDEQCSINKTHPKKNSDQHRAETKPIKINPSTNGNNKVKQRTEMPKPSPCSFEDVRVNDSDESLDSPPIRHEHPTAARQKNKTDRNPKQLNFDENLLLDSMIDDDQTDNNRAIRKSNRLSQKSEPNDVLLLLDADEHLTVNSSDEFIRQLRANSDDPSVKCVSIIGNTGDGKSYTLNQIFYNGDEKFHTSATSESCTMGVWCALDENQKTLVLDTEGRLGLSQNDNRRNRLLLKILCISDIVIFRTKAPKLPNDMFQFLSDASAAFLKYFKKELENVMKSCKVDGPVSTMGPTLIVFHETQHTEVLRDHFQCQKTAVEQLKERFEKMNLPYEAYSSIEYVGIQTEGGKPTDFTAIKATVTAVLENTKIRSQRRLSVIFKALKALNEKFIHDIPPEMPSTLPDDFFSCCMKCLSCDTKCIMPANHQKENILHSCERKCSYNKDLDNEVWKCLACQREGRDVIVYGKLITKNDGLVQGLLKYVWSGFVIECPHHGEIYRSRKYWYGNSEPKDVTRVEVIHVWPGDDSSRLASDVTPRKFMEMIVYAGSYLAAPTKMITEMVADQVAPSYWVPNKDAYKCASCDLQFGSDFSKHHCRACGQVFCDTCTTNRRVVSWIDTDKPVRVCNSCYGNPKTRPPPSVSNPSSSTVSERDRSSNQRSKNSGYETGSSGESASTVSSGEHISDLCLTPIDIFDIEQPGAGPVTADIPTTRRVYETVLSGLEKIGANYPIELIKESTRPNYWRPDNECHACYICKRKFNLTTNRLHHCRNCGDGVCEDCSPTKRCVPERDWLTPVRVCKLCDQAMNESNQ